MCTAIVMAGGRSERMRSTAGQSHKALISVLGVPMIERNLLALFAQGFRDVIVAVNSRERDVLDYVNGRATKLAHGCGATLRCYLEATPLGTIGAAGSVQCDSDPLLVVNVDNLTTLNLRAFVDHHIKERAFLSIATHVELFPIPFGEVVVQDGLVTEYREKPTISIRLSSGTYVLSQGARSCIAKDRRTDLPSLFELLRARGERIVSYGHSAPWIDVNDAASLNRAESLIGQHSSEFGRLTIRRRRGPSSGSAGVLRAGQN
jgi:NDP-sugar pyrophosphorylase family protein